MAVVTASYTTLDEARAAGVVRRDRIPALLPPRAYDIREAHDPQTGRRWGLFSFPPQDADAVRSHLGSTDISLDGVTCDMPRRIEWWPILLRGTLDQARISMTGLKAYRTLHDGLFVVVNWSQGRAYYWAG